MKKYILLLLMSVACYATDHNKYNAYFNEAGVLYNVSPVLLKAIAISENEKMDPDIVKKNRNGTVDVGLMQVNSLWIDEFEDMYLSINTLKDPQTNIMVAARILSRIINKKGYTWESVGEYHSKTRKYKKRWLKRVKAKLVEVRKNASS